MSDVINTTTDRSAQLDVEDIEHQRCMHLDRGVQTEGGFPGLEPNTGNVLLRDARFVQRQAATITGHAIPLWDRGRDK